MKTTFKQIGLAVAIAGALTAQGKLKDLSHGADDPTLDGRFWSDLQQEEKVMLIEGISEGILLAEGEKAFKGSINISPRHSNVDYVKEMDILYADPANSLIPTDEIYMLATRMFNGASSESIKTSLQFWRGALSKRSDK